MSSDTQVRHKGSFMGCLAYLSIGISLIGLVNAAFSCCAPDLGVFVLPVAAFLLGATILVHMRRVHGTRRDQACAIAAVVVAAVALLGAAKAYRGAQMWVERARANQCINNLKQIYAAVELYAQEWDDRLPPVGNWNNAVDLFIRNKKVWECPSPPGDARTSFAVNLRLSGLSRAYVKSPESTVLLFESVAGHNLAGGPELLPDPPRHRAGHNITFVDGHVETVPEAELSSLIWEPVK